MSVTSFTLALLLSGTSVDADRLAQAALPLAQESAAPAQPGAGPAPQPACPPAEAPAGPESAAPAAPDSAEAPAAPDDAPAPAAEAAEAPTAGGPARADPCAAEAPRPLQAEGAAGAGETASDGAPVAPEDEIVVVARYRPSPQDPLAGLNIKTFETIQAVDKAFVGPMAMTYKETVPRPIRSGVRNFLRNLSEPIIFLNFLLQLKPGKAAETAGRFAINSTLGIAGLFDQAKKPPFNLPYRNNGFGYTLGYYGVKPGPFLYLPLIGPTTLRDVSGRLLDMLVLPVAIGKPFNQPVYAIPTTVVRLLDERAESDDEIQAMRSGTGDSYTAMRENYLRTRQAEIDALRGKQPAPDTAPLTVPTLPDVPPLEVPAPQP